VTSMSPYTALATLVLFKQRRLNIDQVTYDQCLDVIIDLLEECNNEKFRLTPSPGYDLTTPES